MKVTYTEADVIDAIKRDVEARGEHHPVRVELCIEQRGHSLIVTADVDVIRKDAPGRRQH